MLIGCNTIIDGKPASLPIRNAILLTSFKSCKNFDHITLFKNKTLTELILVIPHGTHYRSWTPRNRGSKADILKVKKVWMKRLAKLLCNSIFFFSQPVECLFESTGLWIEEW
jgi:hypothetical protein